MTYRKRRRATPALGIHPPYSPLTGEHAPLRDPGIYPYCAMFQVATEDIYANYVVCRGFDPRIKRFVEYDADDLGNKPGISVAKPYGNRHSGLYLVGHVLPAAIPYTRIGQTPGVAETTSGHPAGLDEEIGILYDDNGVAINWLIIEGQFSLRRFEMTGSLAPAAGEKGSAIFHYWVEEDSLYNETLIADVYNTLHGRFSKPATVGGDAGTDGWAVYSIDHRRWEIVWMEMPGMFYGTLEGNLSHGDLTKDVTVVNVITGYDLWGDAWKAANGGLRSQTVYNPSARAGSPLTYWWAGNIGDSVICQWDHSQSLFGIIAVEPNKYEWVGQTVNAGANTIWSPPWAPVT